MAAAEFPLPDVGEGLTEAEIVQWRVAIGDEIAVDQVLVEIETREVAGRAAVAVRRHRHRPAGVGG
ncbi:biotin/lipoyl-containing protein [Curtobacterium flaccumfaciens]|nr:biotin/lipoyl-containing protein [Curtobacterium flaccumfaciens]